MKSPTIIWIVYFSFQFHQFLPHTLWLCCSLHTRFRLLCCTNALIFRPYSITVCNFLETILSDINITTPAFCWFMFTRYIFFYPFIFNLTILLYLKFNFLYTAYTWVMFFNPLCPSLLIDNETIYIEYNYKYIRLKSVFHFSVFFWFLWITWIFLEFHFDFSVFEYFFA